MSILVGPSGRALLQDVVTRDAKCRFGLLASADSDSQQTHDQLMVEHLAAADGGGYDPGKIRAQISAIAERASVDHLIVECDSRTHPIAFASLFLPDDGDGQGFSQIARLSSILLAVDADALVGSIVQGERVSGVTSPSILADQIECADVVVLSGDPAARSFLLAQAVTLALNPRARIVQRAVPETVHAKVLDPRDSFDFEAAFAGAGWRKLMDAEADIQRGDQGVTSFVYRARRPFHPAKFWNLIQNPLPGVFRAKGFFWLATRMDMVGGLNIAGAECHYSPAGRWWAANARENHSGDAEVPDRLKKEWAEPYGDRRQAIALMGIELDVVDLSERLDACLLDVSEMNSGEPLWATLADPFPAWSAKAHHHECEDHDCCHH
ncbi:MAG TPA: GTP-binding protein [Chthoniobacterales bacterium]|nr:GTP-binding protein [Chthoniobacterales bacterium]